MFMLDYNCVNENTKDIHTGIQHSLTRFFGDVNITLNGQCTDSGGGGTKFDLAREIESMHMNYENYLVVTYTLHNLQTSLRNDV